MRNSTFWLRSVAILAVATLGVLAQSANAQATRTWVSGVGDDVNPCSRTAPCKTFAGAISKTAAGGEISVLDPGGYGAVTITKSITINGEGTLAGILNSGTPGITINTTNGANPNAEVIHLRNLSINGAGTGTYGVRVLQAGTVTMENVQISGVTTAGVEIAPIAVDTTPLNVAMTNVKIRDVDAVGVLVTGTNRSLNVALDSVQIQRIATGISVVNNTIAAPPALATVDVNRSAINFSTTAAIAASTANTIVRLSDSTITANTLGLSTASGGQIISYNNNRLRGNTTDGAPTSTIYQR